MVLMIIFGKVPIKIIDFMKTMATNAAKGPIRSKPNITSITQN